MSQLWISVLRSEGYINPTHINQSWVHKEYGTVITPATNGHKMLDKFRFESIYKFVQKKIDKSENENIDKKKTKSQTFMNDGSEIVCVK